MKYAQLIKSALVSLTVNKLRTFLTVLGIVIGILAVITLLSLGQSAQASIEDSVSSLGSDLITIIPGKTRSGSGFSFSPGQTFSMEELEKIEQIPLFFVKGITTSSNSIYKVKYENNDLSLTINGIYNNFWDVRGVEVIQGRAIENREIDTMSRVAVIGADLVEDLFSNNSAIGEKIKINNLSFTVIGVTKARGSNGFVNPDSYIYIPLTTMQKYLSGNNTVMSLFAKASSPDLVAEAQDELKTKMRLVRNLGENEENDFTISSAQQALSILDQVTGILTAFLAAIGAISLLVGGIGIMNIMFVTVNERTREIGLRKSLGATKNDILLQFLIEAMLVTFLGGVLGVASGLGLTYFITSLAALPFIFSFNSLFLAVGVSVSIGLIFGIYPAWKAAQLSPIDALRYE